MRSALVLGMATRTLKAVITTREIDSNAWVVYTAVGANACLSAAPGSLVGNLDVACYPSTCYLTYKGRLVSTKCNEALSEIAEGYRMRTTIALGAKACDVFSSMLHPTRYDLRAWD